MNMSNFVATMAIMANRANHANLSAACSVLTLIKENGGTNKKASSALWALLPEATIQTFAQVKRVSGALNASADKATNGAKQVRAIWLESANADDMTDKLLDIGIASPRSLLDYVAPRKDPRAPSVKTAVEVFMQAAKADGFSEDITPILVFIAEKHAKQMQGLLEQAQAFQAGILKDAIEKNAAIEAKAEKAEKAKAEKAARAAERARLNAEALAEAEKAEQDEKSAKAKKENAEKIKRERATHPKVRDVIEA